MKSIREDLDFYKPSEYKSESLKKNVKSLYCYLKYLPLYLGIKLHCRYYTSVSMYLFPFLISEHPFIFQWVYRDNAYLFTIFVSKHLFLFQWTSCARAYLFNIFVFKYILGFFLCLSSPQSNIFQYNLFSNVLLACTFCVQIIVKGLILTMIVSLKSWKNATCKGFLK